MSDAHTPYGEQHDNHFDEHPHDSDREASVIVLDGPVIETKSRSKRSAERATVRKVASKYDEITNASPAHLELLSKALGVSNNALDLTVAVMTGGRGDLAALTDTISLSEPAEPIDSIVNAISLGRARMKGVWSVLSEMALVTGPINPSDVKAGGAIAKAAGNIGQDDLDEISAVIALARK